MVRLPSRRISPVNHFEWRAFLLIITCFNSEGKYRVQIYPLQKFTLLLEDMKS